MPPAVILDPSTLNFDAPIATLEDILAINPQRYEFQLLDAVLFCDKEQGVFAGYHDIKSDAWWAKAHIPGRPLFPGVLMIESAAQLSGYAYKQLVESDAFLGFAGVDDVKFRGTIKPPCRLVMVGKGRSWKKRRIVTEIQGFVDNTMVFEAVITGMPV